MDDARGAGSLGWRARRAGDDLIHPNAEAISANDDDRQRRRKQQCQYEEDDQLMPSALVCSC